jgi:thymidylate kinase
MTHSSWLRRTVARAELAAIEYAERVRPDLVLKLNVPVDVAHRRKSETPLPLLQAKLHILRQLRFSESTQVVEIDASPPLEEVLLEAKRAVWRCL